MPPASTCPFAAQSDGLPSRGISRKYSRKRSEAKCLSTSGDVGREATEVGAGTEDLLARRR